jgi:CrcB protein
MYLILAIAAGGAIGAVGRHFVNVGAVTMLGTGFPYATLIVNVVGSFLMGVLIHVMAVSWTVSPEMRAFLTVGGLGAFTTFSTFSLDVALLYERGQLFLAGIYIVVSVAISIGALFIGLKLSRVVFP